jgi:phosphoglycolate phosphatase
MDSTSTIVSASRRPPATWLPVPSDDRAAHVIGLGLHEAMQAVLPDVDPAYYPRMVERYRYHFLSRDHELSLFPACTTCWTSCRSAAISWPWPPARAGSA